MNYTNKLSVAMISLFFAIVPAQAGEPKITTRRRQRDDNSFFNTQKERSGIKDVKKDTINNQDAEQFRTEQNQEIEENERDKPKKYFWNCCK